jgi:hypothetical protein
MTESDEAYSPGYVYRHQHYYVGVDPASKSDYTGIVIIREVLREKERFLGDQALTNPLDVKQEAPPPGPEVLYLCLHIERVPIGTEYSAMEARVLDLMAQLEPSAEGRLTLCLDATGVGERSFQEFKKYQLPSGKPMDVVGIVITGGIRWKTITSHYFTVPKPDLTGSARVLLGTKQLQISPKLEYFGALKHELENFTTFKRQEDGKETYGAPLRTGEHDDLVLALSCATWTADHMRKKTHPPVIGKEIPKGLGDGLDQTKVSFLKDEKKGGRWKDLTGFRSD